MPTGGIRTLCTIEGCDNPHYGKGMCRAHWERSRYNIGPIGPWARVAKGADPERPDCWIWTGAFTPSGHSRYGAKPASRVIYEDAIGPVPEGQPLYHMCGNRQCVNPSHLTFSKPSPGGSSTPPETRFWAKVDRRGETECWQWTASKVVGHGQFVPKRGHPVSACRYSYELHNGPIPKGLQVQHLCGDRGCVNPAHLQVVKTAIWASQPRAARRKAAPQAPE